MASNNINTNGGGTSSSISGGSGNNSASFANGNNQQQKGSLSLATYGAIDTSTAATPLWMARVPPKLSALWNEAPEGAVLGDLTFTKGSNPTAKNKKVPPHGNQMNSTNDKNNQKPVQQSLVIHVSPELLKDNDLPSEYSLEAMTKKVPTLHPYSRDPNTASINIHGTVTRSCNLQMMRNSSYRLMCKNRLLSTVSSTRYVKPVETAELTFRKHNSGGTIGKSAGFGDSIARYGKRILEASQMAALGGMTGDDAANKRRKYEGQTTQSVVFELFSQERFWTVKELRSASGGLPEKDIRAVLAEVAEFRRSGEQKGMWELKAEYRNDVGKNNDDNSKAKE